MIFPPIPVANYTQLLAAANVAKEIRPFKPVAFQSGGETWFDGSGAFVLSDAPSWGRVWDRHIQNEQIGNVGVGNLHPAPAVDFEKNFVVALFNGPARGIIGYRVINGIQIGKVATLRLAPVSTNANAANIAVPRPWAFIVLPRSNARIDIQLPQGDRWATVASAPPSQ